MFVIIVEYTADLTAVDAVMPAHLEWLDQHYRSGLFLASGRRVPRTGGVVLAQGERATVEAAVAADPFTTQGVAHSTVIEFTPSRFGGALDTDAIRAALG